MKIIKLIPILVALFLLSTPAFCGLNAFKQDFAKISDNQQKQDEDQKPAAAAVSAAQAVQTDYVSPAQVMPVIIAQTNNDSQLNNFYNDFKSNKKKAGDSESDQPAAVVPSNNSYNNYYYTPDYYRYNYPYNYPYYNYYRMDDVDMYRDRRGVTYKGHTVIKGMEESGAVTPERHTWYDTSLSYQSISKDLSAVGMMMSVISAGKMDELSWGFKFDYDLYTEKQETGDHITLPISNMGFIFGKQMGNGMAESFIAYCKMQDLSGLSLKLSTDQWFQKYLFISGGIGVSIINDSPLTDLHAGIGAGNSMIQFVVGYRSTSSVNTQLNGPEMRLKVIL